MKKVFLLRNIILTYMVLAFGVNAGAEEIMSIFTPAAARDSVAAKSLADPAVTGHQQKIKVQLDPLRENKKSYKKVRMDFLGRSIIVRRTKLMKGEKGSSTWFGKPENQPGTVVMSVAGKALFGRIELADGEYKIEPAREAETYNIFKLDPGKAAPIDDGGVMPPINKLSGKNNEAPASSPRTKVQALSTGADNGSVIDVLVLYTKGFAAEYPDDQLAAQINFLMGVANASYTNSEIDLTARVVGKQEVDYTDYGTMDAAFLDLAWGLGVFSGVADLRNQVGADLVVLLRTFNDQNKYCGISSQMTSSFKDNPVKFEEFAYAVVQVGSIAKFYCNDQNMAHEMGHIMGCGHNIEDAGNSYIEPFFPFSYGYRSRRYRTVMAYPSAKNETPISYFSNPGVYYRSLPTGTKKANNALTINKTRFFVSQFRDSAPGSPPIITSFSPTKGEIGTTVTVSGKNFYTIPELNSVQFNGAEAKVSGASYTNLTVTAPDGATSGPITVATYRGSTTSSGIFTVQSPAPSISGFYPTSGVKGAEITISGKNFSTNERKNIVYVGKKRAQVTKADQQELLVIAPGTSGFITVAVNGKAAKSSTKFMNSSN